MNVPLVSSYSIAPSPLGALAVPTERSVNEIPLPPAEVRSVPGSHLFVVPFHFKTCPGDGEGALTFDNEFNGISLGSHTLVLLFQPRNVPIAGVPPMVTS